MPFDSFVHEKTDIDGRQGWEMLCPFLGKPVPKEPYPLANDSGAFYSGQEEYVWLVYGVFFKKIAVSLLPVVLGFVARRMRLWVGLRVKTNQQICRSLISRISRSWNVFAIFVLSY